MSETPGDPTSPPTQSTSDAKGPFGDLRLRILAAVILASISFFALWMGGAVLVIFAMAIACLMLLELNSMAQSDGGLSAKGGYGLVVVGTMSVVCAALGAVWAVLGLIVALGLVYLFNERQLDWRTAAIMAMIVLGAASAVVLRERESLIVFVWIVACVAAADSGGYIFGRVIGGPKLAPRLSPKKTWSGFLGGVGLSLLLSAIILAIFGGQVGPVLIWAVIFAFVALAGDLMESAAKRYYGVKDAGTILPGHGGLMDRFDGMAPVLILCVIVSYLKPFGPLLGDG